MAIIYDLIGFHCILHITLLTVTPQNSVTMNVYHISWGMFNMSFSIVVSAMRSSKHIYDLCLFSSANLKWCFLQIICILRLETVLTHSRDMLIVAHFVLRQDYMVWRPQQSMCKLFCQRHFRMNSAGIFQPLALGNYRMGARFGEMMRSRWSRRFWCALIRFLASFDHWHLYRVKWLHSTTFNGFNIYSKWIHHPFRIISTFIYIIYIT